MCRGIRWSGIQCVQLSGERRTRLTISSGDEKNRIKMGDTEHHQQLHASFERLKQLQVEYEELKLGREDASQRRSEAENGLSELKASVHALRYTVAAIKKQ